MPDALVLRYHNLVRPIRAPGHWHYQITYPGPFLPGDRALTLEDSRAVLEHHCHVAVRARDDGMTGHIAFDIDCAGAMEIASRDKRYRTIRRVMGVERVPLVYQTPSGRGLRVVYRIPDMRLEQLVTGPQTGLVADVLRAAKEFVGQGHIEIFPQKSQVDRLPLGRDMPLLDAATLKPLEGATIGSVPDPAAVAAALTAMERWDQAPYHDLVSHLTTLPIQPRLRVGCQGAASHTHDFVRVGSSAKPSDGTKRLIVTGLSATSSRSAAEWRVGMAIVLAPELFEEFGIHGHNDAAIAHTLACWLAERHNGFSAEWSASVRTAPRVGAAIDAWTSRYLTVSGANGETMIQRVRRVASALDGSLRRTFMLSASERRDMMHLVEREGLRGSQRYRAEVWLAASRRAVKRIMAYHARKGTPVTEHLRRGERIVVVEIAARWMQSWPYGKGAVRREDGGRSTAYLRYRQLLIRDGWMRLERFSPTARAFHSGARLPDDLAFVASTYRVRRPDVDVMVRDVGVDARTLQAVLEERPISMSGRPIGLDEAHHILSVARDALPLTCRYGSRLGRRIAAIADELERGLTFRAS